MLRVLTTIKKNAMKWVVGEQRLEGSMSEVCFP